MRINAGALNRLKQQISARKSLRHGSAGFMLGTLETASHAGAPQSLLSIEDFVLFADFRNGRLNPYEAAAEFLQHWPQPFNGEPRPVGLFRTSFRGERSPTQEDLRLMTEYFGDSKVLLLIDDSGPRTPATFYRLSSANGPGTHASYPLYLDAPHAKDVLSGRPTATVSFPDRTSSELMPDETVASVRPGGWVRTVSGTQIGLALAVAAVLVLSALQYRTMKLLDQRFEAPKVSDGLDLKVERVGGERQWRLSWNRSATPIQKAAKGHVSIIDGYLHKDIDLTPAEVQTGDIVYAPVADDVTFRLEVFDTQAGRAVSESVRVLESPWPYAESAGVYRREPALPMARESEQDGRLVRRLPRPGREDLSHPAKAGGEPPDGGPPSARSDSSSAPALKPFTPPSRPPEPLVVSRTINDLPVPPALQSNSESAANVVPPLASAGTNSPPIPKTASAPPARGADGRAKIPNEGAQPPSATAPAGGQNSYSVEPPVLLHRTAPEYPALASRLRLTGTVRLKAIVGADGRLHDPQVLSGHALLRSAAIEALKNWVYRPARINGQNISAPTVIEIIYGPGR